MLVKILDSSKRNLFTGTWEIRFDLQSFDNIKHFAKYATFQVLGEAERYKLVIGAFTEGNAGKRLLTHCTQSTSV